MKITELKPSTNELFEAFKAMIADEVHVEGVELSEEEIDGMARDLTYNLDVQEQLLTTVTAEVRRSQFGVTA